MRRSSLLALLIGLCLPLHPSFAHGWMEIEGRRPGAPIGPVARVGSRVTITVDERVGRVQATAAPRWRRGVTSIRSRARRRSPTSPSG